MTDLIDELERLHREGRTAVDRAETAEELERLRLDLLGRKGRLTSILRRLGELDPEERRRVGAEANRVKDELTERLTARKAAAETSAAPADRPDLTLPGRGAWRGGVHPVTRVVDGDTLWISSADVRIRVWGLDAPETDQPGGSAATSALPRLISGQTLTCRQHDIDRYGRIVGQCFLPDGRDITAAMIASGTAREFCRYSGNHYRTC